MQKYSDAELVALYLESRGSQYLTELFTRHGNIVYRTALRVMKNPSDAEDIMQTVYCKMITSLHLYKGTGSVIGWMLQIVIHTCFNQRQSEKSRVNRDKKIMSERVQTVSPKNDELKEIMETHLNKLPEIYKVPITLQIMEGLSIKEVSEALEIPEKTIRSQIARGLEKLKVSLQNVGITASVMMIGESLKQVPMPLAPASINSNAYFQTLIKSKAAASTKLAVVATSKGILSAKIISLIIIASVSLITYMNWSPSTIKPVSVGKMQQWDFENSTGLEDYKTIGLVKGAISIEEGRGVKNSKYLNIAENSVVEIDISQYQLPISISYDLDVMEKDKMENQILFDDKSGDINKKLPFFSGLRGPLDILPNQSINKSLGFTGNWFSQVAYIDEKSYDCWVNGKRSHLLLGLSTENKKVYLSFNGQALVDNLKVESIEKRKLPDIGNFEKVALTYTYKDGSENYPIDKTKLGYDATSKVKPSLKFLSTVLRKNADSGSKSIIYPRISENGKVVWSNQRSFTSNNWNFENNNDLEPYRTIGLISGDIQIVDKTGVNNSKALQTNETSVIAFDVSKYQFPIKVSFKFDFYADDFDSSQRIILGNYAKGKKVVELSELQERIYVANSTTNPKQGNSYTGVWYDYEFFIDEKGVDFWINGKRSHILLGESINTNKIFLYLGGKSKLDDLEIQSIKSSALPDRAVCEKIANGFKLKEGINEYDLDKVALGLGENSKVAPHIVFRNFDFLEERLNLNKMPAFASIGQNNQVEWVKPRQKVSKKWEFETFKELLDFNLVTGSIFLEKNRGENNSNCLGINTDTIFSIDISEYQLPLKITQTFDIVLPPNGLDGGIVIVKNDLKPKTNFFNFRNILAARTIDDVGKIEKNQNTSAGYTGKWLKRIIYVSEDCIDIWFEGKRNSLMYQSSINNKKLYLLIFNQMIVDNLKIETIEPNELPNYNQFKNFVATIPFKKGLNKITPDNEALGIDKNLKSEVVYYDGGYLEESLGLHRNKKVEVMKEK